MAVSTIDWSYWLQMPRVRVWQAVALSLDIDPLRLQAYEGGPPAMDNQVIFWNSFLRQEFDKRVQLLRASISDSRYFTQNPPNARGVQLVEVAMWLKALNRTPIAGELLATTPTPDTADERAANESVWVERVRKMGQKIRDDNDKRSIEAIAQELQKVCAAAGICSARGGVLSAETIRKYALKGMRIPRHRPNILVAQRTPKRTPKPESSK